MKRGWIFGGVLMFYGLFIWAWKRFMNRVDPPDPPDIERKRIRENDEKFFERIRKKPP